MIKIVPFKSHSLLAILALFFLSQSVFAQLADFTLNVTATNETCTGNGTLTFATQNTTPGATLIYSVYLLPDTTTPIAVLSGNTITGLSAGTYRVVALQTLGNESNSQQQDLTILNEIVPLTFQVAGTPESCANGTITVTAQGNVATYEIISGPQVVAPQTSNVFTGLAAGTYNIRVTDTCGDAYVQTFTLEGISYLLISNFELKCNMIDCNNVAVTFVVHTDVESFPGMEIVYPLAVTITVHPPGGGAPIVITQTLTSGGINEVIVNSGIPFFPGQPYTCDIAVTDSCGHTFVNTGNQILEDFTLTLEPTTGITGLSINTCHGMPPYTVNFTSAPAGFDPINHNSGHPGPFFTMPIVYTSTPEHEMPAGDYDVVVTDSCGNIVSGGDSIVVCPTSYVITPVCPKNGLVRAPDSGALLQTAIITEAPVGFPEPLPYDISAFIDASGHLLITLPAGHYVIQGLTVCPKPYRFEFTIEEPSIEATGANEVGCDTTTGSITLELKEGLGLQSVIIIQAPTGFIGDLPFDASANITSPATFEMNGLMYGDYVLTVTDICGNIYTVNVNVPLLISNEPPALTSLPGCGVGYGTITVIAPNGPLQQIIITAAPSGYPFALPHDVSFGINTNGALTFGPLAEGTYSFYSKDNCGVEHNFTRTFTGFHIEANDVEVFGNCGSFDLGLHYSPTTPYGQAFWLQKYNPVTGQWGHPLTGEPYTGTLTPVNSYALTNNAVNYNIAVLGQFRIIRSNLIYTTGSVQWTVCTEVIKEFEFNGQLKISSAYSIPCSNGISQVIVIAGDTYPLKYRITEKDGAPFFVDNGNSNLFAGLTPGIYNFQVEDLCGNIANRLFDIISLAEPEITAHSLCNGQNGYLSVQGISYLNYQWWNGNDPTTILSTNSSLYFSPFSQLTTPGTYFVRIYSTTSLSCIDLTISYTIPPAFIPNAGQDGVTNLCGSNASIDLFTLLGGTFHTTGYWQETSGSGMLSGHTWLPVGLPPGIYTFKYHVDGFCDDFDEATVTIDFKGAAPTPVITADHESCSGGEIHFFANNIPGVSYHWTGPNAFSSNEQNPVIPKSTAAHAGMYTLTIGINGCEASASLTLGINGSPDLDIVQSCENGAYVLKAVPVNDTFNTGEVTYQWTGPQNFSSSNNPVTITGLPAGTYTATVTTSAGCTKSEMMFVANTRCMIPSGISPNDDGDNDSFDLTGFDILKFKIFNRHGRLVFEQDDYTNQWHGQDYKDRELPDATYYYYIKMRTGEERTGWVYVTK